jgi:hypothetical protein
MEKKCKNPMEIAEEMFWLAWNACGKPLGMGVFRDRPRATRDDVWKNVKTAGDYPGGQSYKRPNEIDGDYVFGRMMKMHLKVNADSIIFSDCELDIEYQGWCGVYPTYEALFNAAVKSLTPPETSTN